MPTFESHEDLDAWRLATELKQWVFKIIARPHVKRHFKFCDDIGRSARSAPANLSEGVLGETQNHLRDALVEKYIDSEEYNSINALNKRALQASTGWYNYLLSCPDDFDQFRKRKPPKE